MARLLLVGFLGLSVLPARAAQPPVQGTDEDGYLYLPYVVNGGQLPLGQHIFLPYLRLNGDLKLNLIANPSFESTNWVTDGGGNQHPSGWTFFAPGNGQTLPFPTKKQGGSNVPATSGGQGEYVHKFFWQLPENERLRGTRGLILNGTLTYKIFSDHIAHALRLSQMLAYSPGRWLKVTGYILGETQPLVCSGSGVLEDDHFVVSVQLGSAADTRFYNVMRNQHAVPNNERAWNKFSVTAQVPGSGQLPLVVIAQSNWGCPVDFFIDHFEVFETAGP